LGGNVGYKPRDDAHRSDAAKGIIMAGGWHLRRFVERSQKLGVEVTNTLESLSLRMLGDGICLRFAYGSFTNSVCHSQAITLLVEFENHVSALALQRPCKEAFLRGEWLRLCATDSDAGDIQRDKFRGTEDMIREILASDEYQSDVLQKNYLKDLLSFERNRLNSHTHGGYKQIIPQLLSTQPGLLIDYYPDYVEEALVYSDLLQLHSIRQLSKITGNQNMLEYFSRYLQRYMSDTPLKQVN